jgi:hypothetical protein
MTSTTWTSHHRRGEVLRRVIESADERRDGILPMDVDGVAETFGDGLDLLGALQLRWHTRLAGRIERELMSQPMDLESAVVAAWCGTAQEMPGVRAILDHYRAHPVDDAMERAMAVSTAKEQSMLAVMAGRSSTTDAAATRVGAAIERRARDAYVAPSRPAGAHAAEPAGLVDRIRAVLAA